MTRCKEPEAIAFRKAADKRVASLFAVESCAPLGLLEMATKPLAKTPGCFGRAAETAALAEKAHDLDIPPNEMSTYWHHRALSLLYAQHYAGRYHQSRAIFHEMLAEEAWTSYDAWQIFENETMAATAKLLTEPAGVARSGCIRIAVETEAFNGSTAPLDVELGQPDIHQTLASFYADLNGRVTMGLNVGHFKRMRAFECHRSETLKRNDDLAAKEQTQTYWKDKQHNARRIAREIKSAQEFPRLAALAVGPTPGISKAEALLEAKTVIECMTRGQVSVSEYHSILARLYKTLGRPELQTIHELYEQIYRTQRLVSFDLLLALIKYNAEHSEPVAMIWGNAGREGTDGPVIASSMSWKWHHEPGVHLFSVGRALECAVVAWHFAFPDKPCKLCDWILFEQRNKARIAGRTLICSIESSAGTGDVKEDKSNSLESKIGRAVFPSQFVPATDKVKHWLIFGRPHCNWPCHAALQPFDLQNRFQSLYWTRTSQAGRSQTELMWQYQALTHRAELQYKRLRDLLGKTDGSRNQNDLERGDEADMATTKMAKILREEARTKALFMCERDAELPDVTQTTSEAEAMRRQQNHEDFLTEQLVVGTEPLRTTDLLGEYNGYRYRVISIPSHTSGHHSFYCLQPQGLEYALSSSEWESRCDVCGSEDFAHVDGCINYICFQCGARLNMFEQHVQGCSWAPPGELRYDEE